MKKQHHTAATLRAYEGDIRRYSEWCADRGLVPPAWQPELIAEYMVGPMSAKKAPTIVVFKNAIEWATAPLGVASPFRDSTLRDLYEMLLAEKSPDSRQIPKFTRSQVHEMADTTIGDSEEKRVRDRAMILVAHYANLRREEIGDLDVGDVEAVIPEISDKSHCPRRATEEWLRMSGITSGPLFRRVYRTGSIGSDRLSDGKALRKVVDQVAPLIGCGSRYSTESLRPKRSVTELVGELKDRAAVYRRQRDEARIGIQRLEEALVRSQRRIEHLVSSTA